MGTMSKVERMGMERFKVLEQKYRNQVGGYRPHDKTEALRIMMLTDISITLAMILDAITDEDDCKRKELE